MKMSELIELLQEINELFGDIEVKVLAGDDYAEANAIILADIDTQPVAKLCHLHENVS